MNGTFPSTRWSMIDDLADGSADRGEAIRCFFEAYHQPLQAYVDARFAGLQSHDRADLLQEFVSSKLLAVKIYQHARRERSNFRAFLKVCMMNFGRDWLRRRRRYADHLSRLALEPSKQASLGPDELDLAWARVVMLEAIRRFRLGCLADGQAHLWDLFDLRLYRPTLTGQTPPDYQSLSERFGRSEQQLRNLMVTANRRLHRALCEIVRGYIADQACVESEIQELQHILASGLAHPGRGETPPS